MKESDSSAPKASSSRKRAEEIARQTNEQSPESRVTLSSEETRRMLHELQVHQIELEMQNEELRCAQTELDAARARYFDLYDLAPVSYVTISEKGMIMEANLAAANLLGVPRVALVKQPFSRFILKEDEDIYYLYHKQLFKTNEPQTCELRMVRKDETTLWAQLTATAALDDSGVPACRVVLNDVTGRRRAEAELQRTAREWQTTFDATGDAIWILDKDHRVLRSNQTAERFFHRRCSEMLGQRCWTIVHGTAEPHPDCPFERARKSGHREIMELQQGELWFEVTVDPMLNAAGQYSGAVHIVSDITGRKQAEAALRESEARLRLAQSAAHVGIWDYDMKTRFVVWTPEQEALFGFAPGTYDGATNIFEQLLHPEDRPRMAQAIAQAIETGDFEIEFRAKRRDGAVRWFAGYGQIYRDAAGQPARMIGINFDITEKKQMEADFLRIQRMEGIGMLAGGIAHDLNNILAPILMVGPLLREAVSDDESRHLIDTVESCAQRGADIIKQLLTFARGKPGARAPLPARHLLNEMQKIMRETFPRNIESRVNVPKDLWLIMGDATQIHQAVMNLCVNARDAMPEGGKLTVEAANVALDEVSAAMMSGSKPGEYVRLSVTDTGAGIAPEDLEHVFDPFFTTKEIGNGTGLGLPTVLGIVRGHGGFVQVDSQVGRGTVIELYFPASRDAKADGTPERELPVSRGLGELILVVDDEVTVRETMRYALELQGYRVAVAAEGAEALAIYENRRTEIRAVVTDMMMVGMDGPKLVKALRQLDAGLPTIGMTGLSERASMKELDALKLPVMLNKPFATVKLLAALTQVLANPPSAPKVPAL